MERKLEEGLQQWLLARDPDPFDGLDERARRVYRRLVRRSLANGIRISLPLTHRLLDPDDLTDLVARWLEDAPPKTRLYWRLPLEFAEWIRSSDPGILPHPAVADLVHWEAVKVDVRNAPPDDDRALTRHEKPTPDRTVILETSARLGIYHHPVYRMSRSAKSWPEALTTPQFIIAYRRDETPRWRRLSPQSAQLLGQAVQGKTIDDSLTFLSQLYDQVNTEALLDALHTLYELGAVRGFGSP